MRPAGRFCCNAPGCREALAWAEGVYTVEQQLAALKTAGWRVGLGCATCPGCAASVLRAAVRPVVLSLESALRASLRAADNDHDSAGGSLAHTAARFGR